MSEKMLMAPATGSVDTEENWKCEGWTSENSDLIEVEKDKDGDWIEVE